MDGWVDEWMAGRQVCVSIGNDPLQVQPTIKCDPLFSFS